MDEPTHRAASYRPATCCGGCHCAYGHAATPDRPCWGPVSVRDEIGDGYWLHACEGHAEVFSGGEYTPEPVVAPAGGG